MEGVKNQWAALIGYTMIFPYGTQGNSTLHVLLVGY